MQKRYKKLVFMTLFGLAALVIGMISFVYFTDPCNAYSFRNAYQSCGARYFQAGRIRHHLYKNSDFASLSVGSSVAQNFIGADIEKYLGWEKPMRIYIPGYYINEMDSVLRYSLDSGKIKKVLWGIDIYHYEDNAGTLLKQDISTFPAYLYNDTIWDDLPYLVSYSNFRKLINAKSKKRIKKKNYPLTGLNEDFDFWSDSPSRFQRAIRLNTDELSTVTAPPKWKPEIKDFPYATEYVVNLVKQYPDVEFYLFFPPYPYTILTKPDYLNLRYYLVDALEDLPNAKLFDFTQYEEFGGNVAYQYDSGHYQPNINVAMLKMMGQGKGLLTRKNIAAHVKRLKKLLNNYKPYSDYEATIKGQPTVLTVPPKTVENTTGDPVVIDLGKKTYPYIKTMVIKIEADVPNDGEVILTGQWQNPEGGGVTLPLKKGTNTKYIMLNMLPAEQHLTFTFKAGKGQYDIRRIEFKLAKEDF